MNLLLRFETANGPRTVIASSVPLQTAREVVDAMLRAGHHAEYIDRCTAISVEDRVFIKRFEKRPTDCDQTGYRSSERTSPSTMFVAAE
jgi:hypothetical protein